MENETKLSIYRAARTIKRKDNTIYNALRSIYEDSIFVGEISQLWPQLPLVANLRYGLWYSPKFQSTCYFKSTDGHANNWSFNTSRLNFHIALLAGQKGGCIIVDWTRRGKRFPDSMSKTIPIWTCVLNRSISNYLNKLRNDDGSLVDWVSTAEHASNFDCILNCDQRSISICLPEAEAYLHLPIVNSKLDRFSLFNNLPSAVSFAELNLTKGRTLLICCHDGEDISVCVCLAILISLFDYKGSFDGGKSFSRHVSQNVRCGEDSYIFVSLQ